MAGVKGKSGRLPKLKSRINKCGRCGGNDAHICDNESHTFIQCWGCGNTGPMIYIDGRYKADSQKQAIREWNVTSNS